MSLESNAVSPSRQNLGSLQSCLVEGDPDQRRRERRVRRKALFTSVLLQASVLALVLLIPLFAKPAHLITGFMTPVPPYTRAVQETHARPVTTQRAHFRGVCVTCVPLHSGRTNTFLSMSRRPFKTLFQAPSLERLAQAASSQARSRDRRLRPSLTERSRLA